MLFLLCMDFDSGVVVKLKSFVCVWIALYEMRSLIFYDATRTHNSLRYYVS